MIRHSLRVLLACLMLSALTAVAQTSNVKRVGLASHYILTDEYYIGALYLENTPTSPEEALSQRGAKRMELRVTIDTWRSRPFSSTWLQLININNAPADLAPFAQEVQAFANLVEDRLEFGDQIRIDLIPGKGVLVMVNTVPVLQVRNEAFFNVLLRCWLGPRPPSSDFKQSIVRIHQGNLDMGDRFDVTVADGSRRRDVANWANAKALNPTAAASTTAPASTPRPAAPVATAATPAPVASQATPTPPVARAPQTAPAPTPTPTVPAPTTPVQAAPAVVAAEAPKPAQAQPAPADPSPAADDDSPLISSIEVTDDAAPSDADTLRKTYRARILRDTYRRVTYPERAVSRNQEGEVVLTLTVTRNGELSKLEVSKRSYPALNGAAEDAAKRAAPFTAAPDGLPGDSFTFDIPIVFKIPR